MDQTTPVILKAYAPEQNKVIVEVSSGYRYTSDLTSFSRVYCYPRTPEDWDSVFIDSDGLALIWSTRFEVHVDQIIACAIHKELISSDQELHAP